MPDSDVIWSQSHLGIYCYNKLYLCADYQYTIGGDTTIGMNDYKIINRSGYFYDGNLAPHYFFEYAGALRQNIDTKTVFFIEENTTQEKLLYDFNLNNGDTLGIAYNNPEEYIFVSSIDSVLIGDQYRKRFNLENSGTGAQEIIEGIGSSAGLIEPLFQFEDNYILRCFNLNDSLYYPNYGIFCDLITKVNELQKNTGQLKIIPNPASKSSAIKIKGINVKKGKIQIFNCKGQMVYNFDVIDKTSIQININDLSPGFYFCILKSDDNSIKQMAKFFKQ